MKSRGHVPDHDQAEGGWTLSGALSLESKITGSWIQGFLMGEKILPFGSMGLSKPHCSVELVLLMMVSPFVCGIGVSLFWGQQEADTGRPLRDTCRTLRGRPTEA